MLNTLIRNAFLLHVTVTCANVLAQDRDPVRVGLWPRFGGGGEMNSVAVEGNYAYCTVKHENGCGGSGSLLIFDVSDLTGTPIEPEPVGSYLFEDGAPSMIKISGDYAYVIVALELCADLVQVMDVRDPTAPRPVGDYHDIPLDFSIGGDYLYVVERDPGSDHSELIVLDARDPSGLREVTRVLDLTHPSSVVVSGNYAYVSKSEPVELVVLDVTDPTRPLRVGSLEGVGGVVAVGDGVALAGAEPTPGGVCGMTVVDVRDPHNPRLVGTRSRGCDITRPGIVAAGDILYMGVSIYDASDPADLRPLSVLDVNPDAVNALFPTSDRVYLAGPAGLQVVDVSVLEYPARLGGWSTRDIVSVVAVSGGHAYVAGYDAFSPGGRSTALHVLDVSDPATPRRVSGLGDFPDVGDSIPTSEDLVLSGSHAYMAGAGGLYVLDVSDPIAGQLVASVAASGGVLNLSVSGSYAYLAGFGGLDVFEVRDPARPTLVGHIDEFARDVFVSGPHAYVTGSSRLSVFDVSDPRDPRLLGGCECGGNDEAVFVSGSYGYTVGEGLAVLDVSDPSSPSLLGSLSDLGALRDVVVAGDRAFIVAGGEGVKVVDVSNPKLPALLDEYPSFGESEDVAVSGDLVYVADRYGGLHVIDPSIPVKPAPLVGTIETALSVSDLVVSGGNAYVVDASANLHVVDVADPGVPRRVARYENLPNAGRVAPIDNPNQLFVAGKLVYVVDHTQVDTTILAVLDLSDPASPERLGRYDVGFRSQTSFVVDGYAYLGQAGFDEARVAVIDLQKPADPRHVGDYLTTGLVHGLSVSGSYAFLSVEGLEVVDMSDPTAPRLARRYPDILLRVVVSGKHLYAGYSADDGRGLQIFDASDPTDLQPLGRYLDGNFATIHVVAGDYAYIHDRQIIDVSDPTAPRLVGRYIGSAALFARDAYLYGKQAGGLQIIDVSPLANPQRVGSHELTLSPEGFRVGIVDVAVAGDVAYVAHGANGLFLFDVSQPDKPRQITRHETSDEPQGVFVVGSHAYIADGWAGLEVLDVSDPANPARLGGLDTEGYAEGVFVDGDVAYVADWTSGLEIIDVSDRTAPRWVGGFDEGFGQGIGFANSVAVSGDHGYVAAESSGLHVFDVSNPASPRQVGTYGPDALEVVVQGTQVYVTYGNGLIVRDSNDPTNLELVGHYPFPSASRFAVSGDYAYVLAREILHVVDLSDPAAPRRVGRNSSLQFGLAAALSGDAVFVAEPDRFSVFQLSRPFPPTGVAAQAGDGEMEVSWRVPSGGRSPIGYDVYRVAPGSRVRLNAQPVTETSFRITGLENGLEHCFAVQSVSASGERSIDSAPPACAIPAAPAPRFLRGDCNGDGRVTGQVTDAVFLLNYNFKAGPKPSCLAACDANGDGRATGQVSDAVYLLNYNFHAGPMPPEPFPECGSGTESDAALGCERRRDCQ